MFLRLLTLGSVVLATGCVTPMTTTTTVQTQRLLLNTAPAVPPSMAGGSGLALGLRLLPLAPTNATSTGAVAYGTMEPELSGLVQFGQGTSLSARIGFVPGTVGVQAPPSPVGVDQEGAFEFAVGVGHDFAVKPSVWGLTLSGELGGTLATLITTTVPSTGRQTTTVAQPSLRGAAGAWGMVGPVRLYAGASVGTAALNDATGSRTDTCTFTCSTRETGRTDITAMVMLGGGARWQASSFLSLGVEAWAPLNSPGAHLPLVTAVTLRLGNFERTPKAPFTPMAPPAFEQPAPVIIPDPVTAPAVAPPPV